MIAILQQQQQLTCTPAAGPLFVPRPRLLLAVVCATAFFGGAALTPALTGRAAPTNAMTSLEMMRHGNVSVNVGFPRAAFRVGDIGTRATHAAHFQRPHTGLGPDNVLLHGGCGGIIGARRVHAVSRVVSWD